MKEVPEKMEKKSKKPIVILIVIILLIAAGATAGYFLWFKDRGTQVKKDGKLVYVESVESITGAGYLGLETRFMGIVESQETKGVNKDSNKTVKEVFVKVGDSVKEGDELFIYDTQEMELQLQQLNLDLQGINNRISSISASINDLSNQRKSATSEDERLSLTSQINSYNASLNEEQYNLSVKNLEIERQQEAIESAAVTAPMDGMIKAINENAQGSDMGYNSADTSNAFITIMAEGDFRIKGTVTEQNIYSLNQGTPVIIRSRLNDDTWYGFITKIDMEPQKNNGDMGYYDSGMGESASKYSFYVNPETTEGLMLGQHLYIEIDNGQGEQKEGMYIPSYYLMNEEDGYFVWKQVDDHIEKTAVTVGDYDENTDSYNVTNGLTNSDYIAFPDEGIEDGCPVTTDYEEYMEQFDGEEGYEDGGFGGEGEGFGGEGESYEDDGLGGQGYNGVGGGGGVDLYSPEENGSSPDNGADEETTFSTDYLTDEELMQDVIIDEDVIPNESGQ